MDILALMAEPATGKRKVSQALATINGQAYIFSSSGVLTEYYPHVIDSKDPQKRTVDEMVRNHEFASDYTVGACFADFINDDCDRTTDLLILDGYPRTIEQAQNFSEWIKKLKACNDKSFVMVAELYVTAEERAKRQKARALEEDRESDHCQRQTNKRLEFYSSQRDDMVNSFQNQDIYFKRFDCRDSEGIPGYDIVAPKIAATMFVEK